MSSITPPARDPSAKVSSGTELHRPPVETAAPKPLDALVMSIDLNGSITEANRLALQVLGDTKDQVIGTHYGRYLLLSHLNMGRESDASLDDPAASCLATGQTFLSAYGMLRRMDRRPLQPIEVSIAPAYRQGAIAGAILMIDAVEVNSTLRSPSVAA